MILKTILGILTYGVKLYGICYWVLGLLGFRVWIMDVWKDKGIYDSDQTHRVVVAILGGTLIFFLPEIIRWIYSLII